MENNWYDDIDYDELMKPVPCSNCGKPIACGLMNAVEHYVECYTDKERRQFIKNNMLEIGYSNSQAEQTLKNLGL